MKRLVLALATAAAVAVSTHAIAATSAPAVMLVSATVLSSCLVTALPLTFGQYKATDGANTTATTSVGVLCTGTTTATINLDHGLFPDATTRKMGLLTDRLSYNLFQPVSGVAGAACAYTVPFADGLGGFGAGLPITGVTVVPQMWNVCGSIPAGQNAPIGAYADTVQVTVTF